MTSIAAEADAIEFKCVTTRKENIQILHVDDDPSILRTSKLILTMQGNFEVDNATSVDEAFKKLSTLQYDAIISDYEMQQKNGLTFLKELREQKNEIPFILFTGKGREEIAIQALNLGADAYVNKQGDPETVYGELSHELQRAVERQKSKKLLNESELKYGVLVENLLQGLCIAKGPDIHITFANPAMEKITGYSPKELLAMTTDQVAQLIFAEDREIFLARFNRRITGEEVQQAYEFRIIRKDGKISWLEVWTKLLDENSKSVMASFLDITDKKKAKEKLQINESHFRTLYENSSDAIFITDSNGLILSANVSACKFANKSEDELKEINAHQLVVWDERARLAFAEREKTGKTTAQLTLRKVADGSVYEAEISSSLFKDSDGTVKASITIRDVTERKKSEEALRKSELRFRKLIENAPYGIYVTDMNGKFIDGNKVSRELIGYEPGELVGKGILDLGLLDEKNIATAMKDISSAIQGHPTGPTEYELRRRDGKVANVEITSFVINLDKDKMEYVGITKDITERKKVEQAFRQSEERFCKVFNDSPVAMAISRMSDGVMVDINEACLLMLGYSRQEAIGSKTLELKIIINEAIRKQIMPILKQKGMVRNMEMPITTKTGNHLIGIVSVDRITVANQDYILATFVDITARKMMEEKLREDQAKLEIANEKLQVVGSLTRA